MAERLFRGQIQPQARPLNSFLQPSQNNLPGVTQQQQLQVGRGIVTQQQAGTSSVAGYNQMAQLADALAPFSKNLTQVVNKGFRQYAIGSIEAGYYDELKNEQLRAKLRMQENQESGTAQAAETITALERVDPIAASLAREANPWKLIGRRRAVAQLAAGEVSARFNAVLAQRAGELGAMAPGSDALMEVKAETTREVLSDFGLSGDELESAYYVSPQVNKSWDKFTAKQGELYSAEVYRSQVALTGAAVKTKLTTMATDGVVLPTGERIMPGDPRFGLVAGVELTREIDNGLRLLGGEDKTKALESIRQNLGYLYNSNAPGVVEAIGNVRLGSSSIPMEKRPRWMDANPYELRDYSNKALKLENEGYEASQQGIKNLAEQLWNQTMAGLVVDTPEYQAALKKFEATLEGMGYRDTAGFIRSRVADDQAVITGNGGAGALTFEERTNFEDALRQMSPYEMDTPENVNTAYSLARQMAAREPTEELRQKAYDRYKKILEQKQKELSTLPANSAFRSSVNNAVKADLGRPDIAKLRGSTTWQNGSWGNANGQAPTKSEQAYREFGNTVRSLYTQEYWNRIQKWRAENPGLTVDPGTESRLMTETTEAVRKSPEYKEALKRALGGTTTQTNQPTTPVNQNPANGPVPKGAAPSITPEQARRYKDKPVMQATWVHAELKGLVSTGGQGVSKELTELADSIGVEPYRYLIEQLKFYPKLDPQGTARQWLLEELRKKKSGSTPATSQGNQSSTSRSPGEWLNAMVMPLKGDSPYWNGDSLLSAYQGQTARLPGGVSGPVQWPIHANSSVTALASSLMAGKTGRLPWVLSQSWAPSMYRKSSSPFRLIGTRIKRAVLPASDSNHHPVTPCNPSLPSPISKKKSCSNCSRLSMRTPKH